MNYHVINRPLTVSTSNKIKLELCESNDCDHNTVVMIILLCAL